MDKNLPSGIELTVLNDKFRLDPYPILRELRRAAPVRYDERMKCWFVTGASDVRHLLSDAGMSSDPKNWQSSSQTARGITRTAPRPSMIFSDDPLHKRLRSRVARVLNAKYALDVRRRAREVAVELVGRIRGAEFELVESVAAPLPTIIVAELLGIPKDEQEMFKQWSDDVVANVGNIGGDKQRLKRAQESQQSLEALSQRVVAERRSNPQPDLISSLVARGDGESALSDEEILGLCTLVLTAGTTTTRDLIGNGVRALVRYPEQLTFLRADPSLLENAVEEMLRFDTPVIIAQRFATRDVSVRDHVIRKGEAVITSLAAANRDEDVHPEPDRFEVGREQIHVQSFGGGRHLCLGAPLARVEAQEAIAALLGRFKALTESPRGMRLRRNQGYRGLAEYWLSGVE
ncbi:MAG: cytochrome P450 [Steroidobacteraceae bacterium]